MRAVPKQSYIADSFLKPILPSVNLLEWRNSEADHSSGGSILSFTRGESLVFLIMRAQVFQRRTGVVVDGRRRMLSPLPSNLSDRRFNHA